MSQSFNANDDAKAIAIPQIFSKNGQAKKPGLVWEKVKIDQCILVRNTLMPVFQFF